MTHSGRSSNLQSTRQRAASFVGAFAAFLFLIVSSTPLAAGATGQASSGELLFYPCVSCHPVPQGSTASAPNGALPNDFLGHEVPLVGHDLLGQGRDACLVCHDGPARDPGKLKLMDGTLVDITGETSGVCLKCHTEKFRAWEAGTHGRGEPSCTAAGCHDPHTPGWIYSEPLLPFVGTGFQTSAVSDRQVFTPLAGPPVAAPVETPQWLVAAASLVGVFAVGIIGYMILGRPANE